MIDIGTSERTAGLKMPFGPHQRDPLAFEFEALDEQVPWYAITVDQLKLVEKQESGSPDLVVE